ncbi:hypothetical protein [Streptomyces albidoflavus]|uniref:hypothetical protein n=1 Tax=Streptomyces albidoflavus TaxID=1886 RepID=UPI0010229AFF|nr:hypothetical protein [Streptomyces albidoflavus]RZF02818.1 hypothetical protein C0R05_31890 [Streptomyces albidoflavus]
MNGTECPSFLRGNVMRVTRLNGCGQPQYGDRNQVTSDGFVTVKMSAEIEEGEETSVTKANGKTCISDKSPDQLKWYTLEMEFCQVDPDLVQMINPTWEPVFDAEGDIIGFDAIGELDASTGFGLELWMDVYGETDTCLGQEAQGEWGYLLLPWCSGGAPGDLEINSGAVSFNFTARTKVGNNWRRGPYNVVLNDVNIPAPLLKAVPKKAHYRLITTAVRPPEPECGAMPVDRPTPEPAELVITGLPNEDPRRTVRLFVDNHGFGPVTIDWGDGSVPEESTEGRWVPHFYTQDGTYTVKVCDKQTPVVCTTRQLTVPLPADEPVIELSCANDASQPNRVAAKVTMPPQSTGWGLIDWGDGTAAQEFDVSRSEGTASLTHTYNAPSIYTVGVRRMDQTRFRSRDAIQVPCEGGGGDAPKVCPPVADPSDATGRTVSLTIGGECGGEDAAPDVSVVEDTTDQTGQTAKVTINNTQS